MPTFAPTPPPLTRRIVSALAALRTARYDGSCTGVTVAEARFRRLLDEYGPAQHSLAETFPDLDARLRVNWKAHR